MRGDNYRHELSASGLKGKTIAGLLWAASVYLSHLVSEGLRSDNPGQVLAPDVKEKPLPRQLLKEVEWEKLLSALESWREHPPLREAQELYRVHVLAELLYAIGMRIAEAASLEPADLDLPRRELKIREGKGGRSRTAFLSDYAAGVLEGFLRLRPLVIHRAFAHTRNLFGMSELNLSIFTNRELKKACTARGLPPVTAHGIRHMAGWHLLRAGASLRAIQGILGHLQIKSTELYTRVDKESLKAVLDCYHPRSEVSEHALEDGEQVL